MHPQKALLFPALAGFPAAIDDVADAPKSADSVRLTEKAMNFGLLPELRALRQLWCFRIGADELQTLARCVSLASLFAENLRLGDLSPLSSLHNLKSLSLETAPKVESLDQLGELGWLEGLAVLHFKSVRSIRPLGRLCGLKALAVAGSMWTRMTVESLAPLSALKSLRFLHLTNLSTVDKSLEPLHGLGALEELECGNLFPMDQFARLAVALPQARCTWFSPFVPLPNLPCKKCGRCKLVLLTGRGSATRCRVCDAARVQRHEEAFEAAKAR